MKIRTIFLSALVTMSFTSLAAAQAAGSGGLGAGGTGGVGAAPGPAGLSGSGGKGGSGGIAGTGGMAAMAGTIGLGGATALGGAGGQGGATGPGGASLGGATSVGGATGLGGAGGAPGSGPLMSYFKDVTSTAFPPSPCNDPANPFKVGCYTSFLVVSDLDGDGDLDIVFANGGGYYTPDETNEAMQTVSGLEPSTVYFNDGKGAFSDVTASTFGGATSRLRQVAIGDVDGDGDLDLYQPGGYGIDDDKLFIQTSKGKFENEAASRLPGGLRSRAGSAHLGDLDNDGDLDLVVGDWGVTPRKSTSNTFVYLNDGAGVFSALPQSTVPAPIEPDVGRTPIDIDLADIDGDFDLDILVNHRNGQSRIFINDGSANFSDGTDGKYPEKKGPYTYNVEACDFDEDGDLDLLLDNAGGNITTEDFFGNISQVLVNDGKGTFTDETAKTISGEPYADDNAVKCADVNGDGHYDFVVASLALPEKLILNDGKGAFSFVEGAFPDTIDPTLGIDVADMNGDKKIDVITGQGEGTPRDDLIYQGSGMSVADKTPPKFRAVEIPTAKALNPIVMRLAVTDAYTSETGEEVKSVYVSYKVDGSVEKKATAKFVGGDLFRVELPPQPAGTVLEITPTAVDRVDLVGKGDVVTLTVGELGEGGSGGIEEPSAGGAVDTPGEGGSPGTSDSLPDDDDCSVSSVGRSRSSLPFIVACGAALVALRRKRRPSR